MPVRGFLNACVRTLNEKSFYTAYHKTFDVIKVETEEQRDDVFRLRYQVYCEENGFIDPRLNKNKMERDIYDRHSLHTLLIHRKSGRAVGTARVVLPRHDKPLYSFPLQHACEHPLLYSEEKIPNLCEISRLCMTGAFRSRPNDGSILPAYYEADWEKKPQEQKEKVVYFRRMIPYAPLGLLMGAFELALGEGISNCLCVLDKGQLEAFQRIGFDYTPIGNEIEFYGQQQPIIFNIKKVLDYMLANNAPCWDIVSDGGRLQAKANKLKAVDALDDITAAPHPETAGDDIQEQAG